MNEEEFDRKLRIKTVGQREFLYQSAHYNRYEATPYSALDEFFNVYELKKSDVVVDFGCGKGRLPFYIHNRFNVSVIGVEMSGQLYQEALGNLVSYMRKVKHGSATIRFERGLAEEYAIEAADNRFYFFNPFSIEIFMKVVNNILLSVELTMRQVDIILYYPTTEYIEFLEMSTPFELFIEVPIRGLFEINDREVFRIYRMGA